MTEIQHGQGTTPERAKRGKIEMTSTMQAGVFSHCERWPDVVAFLVDEEIGMLAPDAAYGWNAFTLLKADRGGYGDGDGGWKQQHWITFQKLVGHKHLRTLEELWVYPVPRSGNDLQIKDCKWRLNCCLHLIREALTAAEGAARKAGEDIKRLRDTK